MLDDYPSDLRDFVAQKIASGGFESVDDFAIQAARVYRELDQRHAKLKQAVTEGLAQLESGDYVKINGEQELREFFENVKRRGRDALAKRNQ